MSSLSQIPIDIVYPTDYGRNATGKLRKIEESEAGGWAPDPLDAVQVTDMGDLKPGAAPDPDENRYFRGLALGLLVGGIAGWWLRSRSRDD